ncbi:tRNA(Ile)(2)-agmatinylcytidine synthase [Methermicoccus shengliensis]|uniref:tRNA(Ile2) 2-agmatinylcytidine synthetase TiaS n=1 Tax=Methermicoccus shengliensis TaxID=660064 RepID=A0A832W057_9EURY|nr:tRNA(Ile)(2)-agmatinylcytidine synthase [Methermicoccus shengliensis]KUK03977.1 MAG: tRNA(Ile2) 2-agmatinylcytidine synthetase TiaS [Euryarchaeota archaeon 55_53]KUK29652.1 MAG: tRNA(Ile2) 2-agmatinylcytidine synthetase TiaS [Methanosarcinales archeaon 56_1174]MDI3488654.1 tRNA(Ile2)-agmatinylcytidine synthase [Methanosarcinales archaeon]MDN5295890.1 tRNA(Ile2)-agmatinylcytidine synthase [Methanosarcinales archaeon]HIH69905.1 DUF1743 domain-containing protein [Methermicoccus shengliensis]
MFIGIDDTDSPDGMCTTYLCAHLVKALGSVGRASHPMLIRLNPNVKFKTRGNAAVAFHFSGAVKEAMDIVIEEVSHLSMLSCENTHPGVVFIQDELLPHIRTSPELLGFPMRAIRHLVSLDEVERLLTKHGIQSFHLKLGRGRIGALAAAITCLVDTHLPEFTSQVLPEHTYELIAYRDRKMWGRPRVVNASSVFRADASSYPRTWDTVDIANRELVCVPNTRCPVLLGIRGESEDAVLEVFSKIECERAAHVMVFKTNQGTDVHLQEGTIGHLVEGESYIVRGVVSKPPYTIRGGHVFFSIADGERELMCAAFEPTKQFRNIVRKLIAGDVVRVWGAYQEGVLNLEKLEVVELVRAVPKNPTCPVCNRSMESAGRNKGFRCSRCHTRHPSRVWAPLERGIEKGLYEVPPCARRHLAKPLVRFEREDVHPMR